MRGGLRPAADAICGVMRRVKVTILTNEINAEPMGFAELGITGQLLKAANAAGFVEPKPIQAKTIPSQLEGRDLLGIAQTGSGKTAAFALPILSKIMALGDKRRPKTARALILAPTRELAVQIEETVRKLSKGAHISTALVLGGVSRHSQVKKIAPGVDVLVATPGRLMDLVRERDLVLADTTWLILDEADRMLDMGFIPDIERICKLVPFTRQTLFFTATMPPEQDHFQSGQNTVHGVRCVSFWNPTRTHVAVSNGFEFFKTVSFNDFIKCGEACIQLCYDLRRSKVFGRLSESLEISKQHTHRVKVLRSNDSGTFQFIRHFLRKDIEK